MAKKKTSVSIQARRRLFFVRPICFGLIMLVLITFAKYSVDLYKLNNEKRQKDQEYVSLQEDAEYLRNEIVKLHDPEELAKFARENYLYSKNGELILQVNKEDDKKAVNDDTKKITNQQTIIICAIGIGLILLYVIIKGIFSRKKR